MLYATPAVDDDDRRVLAEIDAYYDEFLRATGTAHGREWVGGLRKRLIAAAIRGSNTIEGYTVSASTASAIVDDAAVPADVPAESLEAVVGYRNALTWVMYTPQMDFFAYSETVLSMLHHTMMGYWKDKSPGRYRRAGIVVTGQDRMAPAYTAPDADDVPGLMRELIEWLNDGDRDAHPLVRGAMAHLNLVSIHPWRDGNGRMSRCVQTLVIAREGRLASEFCSVEEWLGYEENTHDYYRALRATRRAYEPSGDAHDWLRFSLRAHHIQAQIVDRRVRFGQRVWTAVENIAKSHGLNDRVVAGLDAAATGQLRREVYQQEEGLSRDQAIRDIRGLERAGLVESVGYGAALYYVAAGEARQAVEEVTVSLTAPTVEPYR